MKVVCGSCGAKYSVADDKVAGKTVKIRCKKCSEVIVVRGEQNAFEEDEATRVFDGGGEAVWHVVVNGEQQGPFAPMQISALLIEGKVDAEAYVWKEGFDGWKPLREVPDLSSLAVGGGAADAPHVDAEMEPEAGGDLFGGGKAAEPAAAGADLFSGGASKASAFAGGEDDDGVVASKPSSPRVTAEQSNLTGQRNENSVLFSLSNLQALATGPKGDSGPSPSPLASSAAAAPAPKSAGHAVGDASGLIDIRALASATSSVGANKPSGGGGSANIDELLTMGGGASPLAGGLAAPILAPPPVRREEEVVEKSGGTSKALLAVGGLLVVGLIGAVAFLAHKVLNPPAPTVVERVIVQSGSNEGGSTGSTDAPPAAAGDNPAAAAAGAAGGDNANANATGSTRTTGTTGSARTTGTTGSTRTTGTTGSTAAASNPTPASAPAAAPSAPSTSTTTGGGTEDRMRALLGMTATTGGTTTGGTTTGGSTTGGGASGPAQPSRSDVASALGGVSGQVRACGDGTTHGVASVSVTFASNGSVRSAAVGGDFAGTPAASCISRAVRTARVPPFTNSSFSVTYPYRI